jgi:hypothetical protein
MLGSLIFLFNHDIETCFVMVLLEGFCSEYLPTTARSTGTDKIFDCVNSNTVKNTLSGIAPWFKGIPHCGTIGTQETNIIMCLSFTGVCNSNWEEEDAKLLCYMQIWRKESDMLPHEITTTSPGREWHDSIF